MSRSGSPSKRELWQAHLLYASGQEDQAKLQRAVDELGIKAPRQQPQKRTPKGEREQDIVNGILKLMRLHPRVAMCWRNNVGMAEFDGQPVRFGFVGLSDIQGVTKQGRAIFIEVKKPGKKMTSAQNHFIMRALDAKCIAGCVHSVDEAAAVLKEAWDD